MPVRFSRTRFLRVWGDWKPRKGGQMLRQENMHPLHWADKTMSVLRANQLEACEKKLASFPSCSLFDPSCTDVEAEALYRESFYAREDREIRLHTVEELRKRVLGNLPAELLLLSQEEHMLLTRLLLFGGSLALGDWNDLAPADSLMRRLWCRVNHKHAIPVLHMPKTLSLMLMVLLASDDHNKVRDLIDPVFQRIDNTLYLAGVIRAESPQRHLASLLKGTPAENHPELIQRMLMADFDYIYDQQSRLLLIHPGLAEPDRLNLQSLSQQHYLSMDDEALSALSDSLDELETPIYDHMLGQIYDCTRPELMPEDAVEDLIILAKQDVPFDAMREVLSSMLICLPTENMLIVLRELHDQIPRWLSLNTALVQ